MTDIGDYKVIRLLGKGGMSEVFEVENIRLGSRHALKLFTYEKDDQDVRERFLVEGRLLAKLNHPRIVKVTDFGTDATSGRPYFVMDLILDETGVVKSLGDVEPGTVDEETVGRWYDDLREGLEYIHSNGVIHRDLKLQNALVGPDGHVVLMDFGISKIFDPAGEGNTIVDTVNTIVKLKEGRSLVMGSVGYMAPELEMGVQASPQSDYYALGVIVYRLLTGSWCDSRTDINAMLETYDGVWRSILPALLHSNPNARVCKSYADAKREARERAEFESEERWLAEKRRGHLARHLARWASVLVVILMAAVTYQAVRQNLERRNPTSEGGLADARLQAYDFDALFAIPSEATAEDQLDDDGRIIVPSRENLALARLDALILTHDLFGAMRSGRQSVEGLMQELERLQSLLDENAPMPFDGWPSGYMQAGDDETLYWSLSRAIERLRQLIDV